MNMWYRSKFFRYSLGLLVILLNIYFLSKVDFLLVPVRNVIASIFFPLFISGLLYYLLRPPVNLIVKLKVPRTLAVLLVFILLAVLLYLIIIGTGSMVSGQVNQLFSNLPNFLQVSSQKITEFVKGESLSFIPIDNLQQQLSALVEKIIPFLSQGLISGMATAASAATALIVIPFILFYLLNDDKLFSKYLLKLFPERIKENSSEMIDDIDKTLSVYIISQALIALTTGILMYIGYLILGLDLSLILAMFAILTAFIPIFGSFIGIVPAVIVAITVSPMQVVKVLVLMTIVQLLVGNIMAPLLLGKRLNIHPLTIIIILLAAASIYGFIGMLIAVPVYAIIKIIGKKVYEIYKLYNNHIKKY